MTLKVNSQKIQSPGFHRQLSKKPTIRRNMLFITSEVEDESNSAINKALMLDVLQPDRYKTGSSSRITEK